MVTGVNDIRYEVHLENGVRLTISLPKNRPGPGVQSAITDFQLGAPPYRVQIPGRIVEISASGMGREQRKWIGVAEALGISITFPEEEPEPKKPEPEPYDQFEIPL